MLNISNFYLHKANLQRGKIVLSYVHKQCRNFFQKLNQIIKSSLYLSLYRLVLIQESRINLKFEKTWYFRISI